MQCLLGAGGPSPVIRVTVLILAEDRAGELFTKGSVPCFYVDKEAESSSFVCPFSGATRSKWSLCQSAVFGIGANPIYRMASFTQLLNGGSKTYTLNLTYEVDYNSCLFCTCLHFDFSPSMREEGERCGFAHLRDSTPFTLKQPTQDSVRVSGLRSFTHHLVQTPLVSF